MRTHVSKSFARTGRMHVGSMQRCGVCKIAKRRKVIFEWSWGACSEILVDKMFGGVAGVVQRGKVFLGRDC